MPCRMGVGHVVGSVTHLDRQTPVSGGANEHLKSISVVTIRQPVLYDDLTSKALDIDHSNLFGCRIVLSSQLIADSF